MTFICHITGLEFGEIGGVNVGYTDNGICRKHHRTIQAMLAQPYAWSSKVRRLDYIRSWAIVRLVFGLLQTIGATAGMVLLVSTGVNQLSVAVTGVTLGITILSRIAFRRPRADPSQSIQPHPRQNNPL